MISLLLSLACTDPVQLSVDVVDAFGQPLAEAQVKAEGTTEPVLTDAAGHVELPVVADTTVNLMVGKEGYIHEYQSQVVPVEGQPDPAKFVLFPEPGSPGFFAVGPEAYLHLQAAPIKTIATEMSTWHGLENIPTVNLKQDGDRPLRLMFNSTLRVQELKRQELKLSRLEFKETAKVTGVFGESDVDLKLWVADSDIAYELKGTQSQDDYLLLVSSKLEPGIYAFHAQSILHSTEAEALAKLPKEMQVAYPFEVK